jgi:hypothetical protein
MEHLVSGILKWCIGVTVILIPIGLLTTPTQAQPAPEKPQDKITICHGTNSVDNPYAQHTVNKNSIVMPNGEPTSHGIHYGPVFPEPDWATSSRRSPTTTIMAERRHIRG